MALERKMEREPVPAPKVIPSQNPEGESLKVLNTIMEKMMVLEGKMER